MIIIDHIGYSKQKIVPSNYILIQGLPELELHEYACLSILKFVIDEKKVHDN